MILTVMPHLRNIPCFSIPNVGMICSWVIFLCICWWSFSWLYRSYSAIFFEQLEVGLSEVKVVWNIPGIPPNCILNSDFLDLPDSIQNEVNIEEPWTLFRTQILQKCFLLETIFSSEQRRNYTLKPLKFRFVLLKQPNFFDIVFFLLWRSKLIRFIQASNRLL